MLNFGNIVDIPTAEILGKLLNLEYFITIYHKKMSINCRKFGKTSIINRDIKKCDQKIPADKVVFEIMLFIEEKYQDVHQISKIKLRIF